MVKQIEIFSPDDPFIKDLLETCKVYTGRTIHDNKTEETPRIYIHKLSDKDYKNN